MICTHCGHDIDLPLSAPKMADVKALLDRMNANDRAVLRSWLLARFDLCGHKQDSHPASSDADACVKSEPNSRGNDCEGSSPPRRTLGVDRGLIKVAVTLTNRMLKSLMTSKIRKTGRNRRDYLTVRAQRPRRPGMFAIPDGL